MNCFALFADSISDRDNWFPVSQNKVDITWYVVQIHTSLFPVQEVGLRESIVVSKEYETRCQYFQYMLRNYLKTKKILCCINLQISVLVTGLGITLQQTEVKLVSYEISRQFFQYRTCGCSKIRWRFCRMNLDGHCFCCKTRGYSKTKWSFCWMKSSVIFYARLGVIQK